MKVKIINLTPSEAPDDAGGRVTAVATSVGRTTTYSYEARELPLTLTLPSGHATTTAYDNAGRVATVSDAVGAISLSRDNDGRPLTVTEGGKTLTRVYDQLGRLTQFTDGAGNVLGYAYDDAGNLTTLTYPDGKTVTYTYDAANRVKTVTDWAARVTTYTYDAAGHLTQTSRPNGTSQARTYDTAGQLTGLSELGPGGTTVIYSGSYSYDAASRLASETLAPSVPAVSAVLLTQTFDGDNRLLTSGGQTASFDLDGNLLSLPGAAPASYVYDARNRLTSAGALTYGYDSEGHRVSVTDSTGTSQYVVNPNAALSQVLVSTAANGTVTRYVYGLGLAYEDTAGTPRYYHYDRRGDTVALTDGSGSILGQAAYGVYGEILSSSGQTNTPFLFNGLYGVMTDSNGLYYHRARYYSPQLRRFINQDVTLGSIEIAAGLNRYVYANGDPISKIDPFGLAAADIDPNVMATLLASARLLASNDEGMFSDGSIPFVNNWGEALAAGEAGPVGGGDLAPNNGMSFGEVSDMLDAFAAASANTAQPCIMCHGMTGAGQTGSVTQFAGLSAIPGSGPNAMQGYQTLKSLSVGAVSTAGGLMAGPAIFGTVSVVLPDGMGIGIVQNGQVIASDLTVSTSHAALAAQAGVLGADGTLTGGAQAVTWTVENGTVNVMRSINFPNSNLAPAQRAIVDYLTTLAGK